MIELEMDDVTQENLKATNTKPVIKDEMRQISAMEMKQFYMTVFPHQPYYKWLNYNGEDTVTQNIRNREFSFTIKSDIYLRYQSYNGIEEFKKDLVDKYPNKIDIGAVYNIAPKLAKTVHAEVFKPLEKELVFDIDMTDYDDIRTCCTGGDICNKCWGWMTVAMKILEKTLREDFGFQSIMFVYSGRRGIHCWVCDKRARKMDNNARRAVVGYLTLIKGGSQQSKKVTLGDDKDHPLVLRAIKEVDKVFKKLILEDQELLKHPKTWKNLLEILPQAIAQKLDKKWEEESELLMDGVEQEGGDSNISVGRWEEILQEIKTYNEENKKNKNIRAVPESLIDEIKLQHVYPRLDENVTTHINHLLKSPFCIHPKTGKVCVPIPVGELDRFKPDNVPTIHQLLDSTADGGDQARDQLKKYTNYFETFVKRSIMLNNSGNEGGSVDDW